jgi:multisubunit Na+/H+ antiporter MnhB subunit
MTGSLARLLFPFTLAVAAAVWVKGYAAIGDGFSAGAIAGLGAVVQYVCLDHDEAAGRVGARWAWKFAGGGLTLVLLVGIGPTLFGVLPVTHAPAPGRSVVELGILKLHTATLFDLGVAILVYGALVGTFDRLFPPLKGEEP